MGLINGMQPMPQLAQPAAQQPPSQQPATPPQSAQQAPKQAAAPVDPTAYKRVILAATKYIYDPASMKNILNMIRKAKMPEIGLSQATALIMSKMVEASKGALPQSVRIPAAKGIMALIAELAEKAGIIKNAAQSVNAASRVMGAVMLLAARRKRLQSQAGAQPPAQMNQPQPGAM